VQCLRALPFLLKNKICVVSFSLEKRNLMRFPENWYRLTIEVIFQ